MRLGSTAFAMEGEIPRQYSGEGQDLAPPLYWSEVPEAAKSLVLIVDDPDASDLVAPRPRPWVHWLLYELEPAAAGIEVAGGTLPPGAREGLNDWRRFGYDGPCSPAGRHRYFFRLYALDTRLSQLRRPDRAALEQAMAGHVLAQTELIGRYGSSPDGGEMD
ncbi:YbhB/YbcL family Raf kinase inhibitor-like protein [Paucibacter sp. AS339]|uniref:YbhB/YbcL family Raf kinase inhibitor-like protein n=1 Tax=Paucibacter hankyongi TaxID=3133434 RepID=UPI0030A2F72F